MQTQEIQNTASENESLTLADFGLQVIQTMTTPTRPNKKPRPVWVVSGDVFGLEESFRELGGRVFRGSWSFFEDPSDGILEYIQNNKRLSYAEQVQSRTDRKLLKAIRYESYAANAEARSETRFKAVNSILSLIPLGQPILVGHHSERRHRKDIERMDRNMQKSVEESKKAEYFADKASSLSRADGVLQSRRYIGNRIAESEKSIRQLSKWASAEHPRLIQAQEKLDFWQTRLAEIEAQKREEGLQIASPEVVKVGDLICYKGSWMPVVRVNKKTVTVSHWMDIPSFQYKIPYTRIEKFKSKP